MTSGHRLPKAASHPQNYKEILKNETQHAAGGKRRWIKLWVPGSRCSFQFILLSYLSQKMLAQMPPAAEIPQGEGGGGEGREGRHGVCDCFYECGQRRAGNREETLETSSIPQSTGAARPAERTSLPTSEALPPPARPPVTGGQANVTSRDPGREAPFGQCACALGLCPPQEESPRIDAMGLRAMSAH